MKKILSLLTVSLFLFTSCSSDEPGPQGPQGPPGEPGADGLIGSVFDVEGDFSAENDYSLLVEFQDFTSLEIFETDVVLVYLRGEQAGTADGAPYYAWNLLPQTYYEDNGTVMYKFDHTFYDVNIYLDSNLDLSTLGPQYTDNQTFRIAILPADFASSQKLNFSNYREVMSALETYQRENGKK